MTPSLSISRRSVIALQVEWLQTCFPVTCELLRKKHFIELSRSFTAQSFKLNLQPDELVTQFADFVSTSANADTSPLITAMTELECQLATLSQPTNQAQSILLRLKRFFRSPSRFKFALSGNVALYQSKHGEMEIWLARQPYFQISRPLRGIIGQFWVVERTATGYSISPVSHYHFEFYSQLKQGCSVAQLTPLYTESTIRQLLICLLQGGMAEVTD